MSARLELMRLMLQTAVPLRITALQERGGPNAQDYAWVGEFNENELGRYAEQLLFGGPHAATLANGVARAVAILAFCPGGVSLFGAHFEALPPNQQAGTR